MVFGKVFTYFQYFDWQNTFAPNDSYVHISNTELTEEEIEAEKQNIGAIKKVGLTDDAYQEMSYRMLRKRENPSPNWADKLMFEIYARFGLFIPFVAFFTLFDYIIDWRNSVQLLGTGMCDLISFGTMMMLTVTVIPIMFAIVAQNQEEYEMWESLVRYFTGNVLDPLDDEEEDPTVTKMVNRYSRILYIMFSPFTCVVTQVQCNLSRSHEVGYHIEFNERVNKVFDTMYAGSFEAFDQDEFIALKELQLRAVQYIKYQMAFSKDRLKFCLIEDTIQFNIQVTMFMYRYFTAYKANPGVFEDGNPTVEEGWFGIRDLSMDNKVIYDTMCKLLGTFSAIIMIWIGYFSTERIHEQFSIQKPIGMIRVFAIGFRIMIELIVPAATMGAMMLYFEGYLQAIDANLDDKTCDLFTAGPRIILMYALFPCAFTFGTHLLWQWFLNCTNSGEITKETMKERFKDTVRMSIYNSFITVKYNRLASPLENAPQPYCAKWPQHLILFGSLWIKFLLPLIILVASVPDDTQYNPDFERQMNSGQQVDYQLVYGITNDIHYLSYLRFTDLNTNYRRKQIAPVYLASHEKYRVDDTAFFHYPTEVKKSDSTNLDEEDMDRLKINKFRNKYDPVIGSWNPTADTTGNNNHAAFSWLVTYKLDELDNDELGNFTKYHKDLESTYSETFPNMPETTRIQLSRNLHGKDCTVRQLTSALQFKSLRNTSMVAIDEEKCGVNLKVDILRQKTLKYFHKLNDGSFTDTNPNGEEITHMGNLERFKNFIEEFKSRQVKSILEDGLEDELDRLYDEWYEVILEVPVLMNQPTEKSTFLLNDYIFNNLLNGRKTAVNSAGVKMWIFLYWLAGITCFHVIYVMCEMEHPIWSGIRFKNPILTVCYYLMVPFLLSWYAFLFENGALFESMESFCRMNPEIKNSFNLLSIPIFTIEMNCQTQGSIFASMQRCAYGTACYFYGDDGDIDIGTGGKSWASPGGSGIQRLGFFKNMRYGADRARLLGNPDIVRFMEDGPERQFNKDNIDPDVIAATNSEVDRTAEDKEKNKQAVGRKSADFSPLHYLNTDLKNLYTSLFSVPEVNNMVCMINKDIDLVQMGEVIWNSHEYITDPQGVYNQITVVREREAAKCRRSIQDMAGLHKGGSNSNQINKMFTAVYEDKLSAYDHIETVLKYRFPCEEDDDKTTCEADWTKSETSKIDETSRYEDQQKDLLKEYPKQALECYKFVDVYRDYRADTKQLEDNSEVLAMNAADSDRTSLPDTVKAYKNNGEKYQRPLKGPFMAYKYQTETSGDFIRKYFEFFSVDDYMANQTQTIYENYTNIETEQLSEGQWIEFSKFYDTFDESCTQSFALERLYSSEKIPLSSNIHISKRDVDRLMKSYSKSILDAYLIIPDPTTDDFPDDKRTSYFVNWPMDLTDDDELPILRKYGLRSLGWSYKESKADVGKYQPQKPEYEEDSIKDHDFLKNDEGGIIFDPRKQYAPANLIRHRALANDITDHHFNRLGLEGMVLALPWWETCKNSVPAGKRELARDTGENNSGLIDFEEDDVTYCIYVDSDKYDIMRGQDHFGYWKTDITQPLDTELISQLFEKAITAENDAQVFSSFVKTHYGPRAYAADADCQNIDSELPFYEQDLVTNTNALDEERYTYLRGANRIESKYIKPNGCYYEKFKNSDSVSNSWDDELSEPSLSSLTPEDLADANFIVHQLTLHEIKKHVISAFIDGDVDVDTIDWSAGLAASGRMTNDFKRENTKSETTDWNWRVGTQYDRDAEGKFKCIDPNDPDQDFGAGGYSVSCITEWETYQFDYIQKVLDEARDGTIDGSSADTWLKFELPLSNCVDGEDPCTYEDYIKKYPYTWSVNAKPWLHRQLKPLEYKTEQFLGSEVCTDCFVKWDISNFRENAFMQYQLKKVNIHLPDWLDWEPFKNYIDSSDDTDFKEWAKSTKEYVKKQKDDKKEAWDESNPKKPTYLSSGCIAQYEKENGDIVMMAFGVGMDTKEDAMLWASKGKGNYKPSLIDFQNYDYGDAPISPMYKPYFDVTEMSDWNLQHVNAYRATIKMDENMDLTEVEVTERWSDKSDDVTFFEDFADTHYHKEIKEYDAEKNNEKSINTTVELDSDGKSVHRFNSNNFHLDKSWHFFGREWDYGKYYGNRKDYRTFGSTSNEDKSYDADVLDFNYAYFNLLPTDPIYVMKLSDDLTSENFAAQVLNQDFEPASSKEDITDGKRFYQELETDNGIKPNSTIMLTKIQKNIDNMILFNPANDKFSDGSGTSENDDPPKSYTQHQFGDLHLSNQCVQNPENPEEVFLFATVRRLKPFYYYYCDKWAPWMAFNPEFDKLTKNNYKDKFGKLDNLKDSTGGEIDDQTFLITHNFVEPKQENAKGFRLSDFNYICDNNLINEEDTIFNWPNDTWDSLENIYRDSLVETEGNQGPKMSLHLPTKTKLEMDFGNKPFETNRLKERFVNYYSNKMPGSPVMSELYWDAHDDLVDPNRYDMGTEAHSGVYQLSFLGRKDFQVEVNRTKFGDILKEPNYQTGDSKNVYLETDSKFFTGGYAAKTDDTSVFPSKHLQYHLHPKWMQKYPREGPLRDTANSALQQELQNYCKQLDVTINQKWYLKNLIGNENEDKETRDHIEGETKQFVPEWSYASDRYYTNSDGERVKANEWNRTTWNPNQRVMNLNAQDFGNEFFWATTNRPAELFNYTYAWNHDKDFRDKRSFAERVSVGNRMYQPDHSFMEQSGIDTKWFGLWRAPDWKTGKTYVAGTRDFTVESPPLNFLGYLPSIEQPGTQRSSTWNHPLATSLISRYPDYKEYQTYAAQARRMNGAVWREWEAYMPRAGYTPSPEIFYKYESENNGTLTIKYDVSKYFKDGINFNWEVKKGWSPNCEKDANSNMTDEWVAEHCKETYDQFDYYNPKTLTPLSYAALDMRPDLLPHGLVPGTEGVEDSWFPYGREHHVFYYPRYIRDPLPFAPDETLYRERTREIFPGATLYMGQNGLVKSHQSENNLDQMVPQPQVPMYPDPFRFPWRTDYLEKNDNMVTANITGLNYLTNRMESPEGVKGSSGHVNKNNLTTFGFYQDFKPEYKIHQPINDDTDIENSYPDIKIVDDNTGRPVQIPVVTHNQNAKIHQNFAKCHGIWNLFPVDPFKLAFGNDFGEIEIDDIKAENRELNRFDQALLFRTEYDRANSRIGPKEYGFDNSRSVPIVDRYAVENGQSELAFGLLANPMLFKNNLSYISVGMEMEDGVPDYVLSLNDVLMATYFGDRIMWSGLDDRFAQAYMERYQSSGNYRHHHTGQSSKYPLDETIPDMRSQGFRHVYGFNQWGQPTIHKDASAKEKHQSFELEFTNPMNTIESLAVKSGKSHDTGLPWMYWTMVANRTLDNDDYRRFVKGPDVKERHPFWRMQPVPEKEKYLSPPHPHFRFERYPPSEQWGISEEEIEEWKNSIDDAEINPPYRQQNIKPVYSLNHYKDNSDGNNDHPLRNAQKFLKYFLEPFVIDESHADEFKQYIKKDKELLRPGWTVKQMQAFLNDMMRNRDKEYYQLYHYEDIGRFCSDNYIPNIDHRWYRTQPVVKHKNLELGPDKFITNFRQVDENARVQDFLPANIIQAINTGETPFWMDPENKIETPKETRALKHPYELSNEDNPYFREYQGAKADDSVRNELPMLQNFADSWEPLDTSKTFYKPTKHFTKYDDESPLFTKTGYEFIDKEYTRNQDDVNLRKLGNFYLQLQNKNIPYSKEKPVPTNFVPKLLSLIKMMKNVNSESSDYMKRLIHVNGGDFSNCIKANMETTSEANSFYVQRAKEQARDFHLYGERYACKYLYESRDPSDTAENTTSKCTHPMPNYPDLSTYLSENSLVWEKDGTGATVVDENHEYVPVDYLGMPATVHDDTLLGNKAGDHKSKESGTYTMKALNPINPTTFIPDGVEQVAFEYCDDNADNFDWDALEFHLGDEWKFGPDMHWMRLYDNYLNNHLYENDGVGGNFNNFDDLVYPAVHDDGHMNIRWPDARYYGDHGKGKHAGVAADVYEKNKAEFMVPRNEIGRLADTTDILHNGLTAADWGVALRKEFFEGSDGKDLEDLNNFYKSAGIKWLEPGIGGLDALGDTDITDDSLAGATLKYLNEEKKVESPNLKSIDPRDEFLKSFEDELGLTQAPFMISLDSNENNHGLDDILNMNQSDIKAELDKVQDQLPSSYKHADLANADVYNKYNIVNKHDKPACTSKIYDPLARFQAWDFEEKSTGKTGQFSTNTDYSPIILADPEIVAPYSLSFSYNMNNKVRYNMDNKVEPRLKFNSIIESGLSPQGGACFTLERRLPNLNESLYYPTCLGGVIAGKTTNAAMVWDKKDKKDKKKQWLHKPEFDLPVPLMGHTVVVRPQLQDQICNGELRAVTIQNTILVFGGKMTALGTMEREDGSGSSESTEFPMVLKFIINYYPNTFDPVIDCPVCEESTKDCRKKLEKQREETAKEYTWVRVQAQRPSNFIGQLDEFKSTTHSTAIQTSPIFHSVLNFCPTGSNFMAEKWREDRNPGSNLNQRRRKRAIEEDATAEDLYKDFIWQTKNSSLTLNHAMATFNEMIVPMRFHGLENKQDLPKGYKGQKCMWCDMTNSRIDMMRAPYTEQVQSQVYKDGALQTADASTAIDWPSDGDSMPDQFTLIEYTIDAKKICMEEFEDDETLCRDVTNAVRWLKN